MFFFPWAFVCLHINNYLQRCMKFFFFGLPHKERWPPSTVVAQYDLIQGRKKCTVNKPNNGFLEHFRTEKDTFRLFTSVGQRKILILHKESNFRPLDSAFWCSTTEPQRLRGEGGPLRSLHMTEQFSNQCSIVQNNELTWFVLSTSIVPLTSKEMVFLPLIGP